MKCVNANCNNIILDFTGNVDGRCAKCQLIELMLYFGYPKNDIENMPKDQISIDKQKMIDEGDRRMEDYE